MHPETTILANLSDNPALFAPGRETLVLANLRSLAQMPDYQAMMLAASAQEDEDDFWDEDSWMSSYRPYNVSSEGILRIPVFGVLLHRFPYQVGRWATGYAYIRAALDRGLDDPAVKGILLVCDTPGGEVAGCFELSDHIRDSRDEKPIWGISADAAYSAGYATISAAERVFVTRSGGTGSVGVVTAHVSVEGMLEKAGITVTFIYAGKHKVDGNPYEKLPDAVKSRIQAKIDRIYGEFVALVAKNRGMDEQAVRGTEALTYDARDSLEVGFADAVNEEDEVIAAFAATMQSEWMMARNQTQNPEASDAPATVELSVHETAVAQARAEGTKSGATAERDRLKTVLSSEEATKRPKTAASLAFNPKLADLSAADMIAMLADMPEEKAAAPAAEPAASGANPFVAAMDADGTPGVGAETASDMASPAAQILGSFRLATGSKPKAAGAAR